MRGTTDLMVAVCREVNRDTGQVAVYKLDCEVDGNTLFCLQIRARANPELRYFVALREKWDTPDWQERVTKLLERRAFSERRIHEMDGIEEL